MIYLLFSFWALTWSANFILMDKSGTMFGPFTIAAAGSVCGALSIAVVWKLNKSGWGFKRKHILPLCFVTLFYHMYPLAMQPFLVREIGNGFVGMLTCLIPIFTLALSIPILKIYPSRRQIIGVLGGFAGIVVIMSDAFDRDINFFYLSLAISVPLCFALGNVLINRHFQDVSPISTSLLTLGCAGLLLSPAGLSMESVNMEADVLVATTALLFLSIVSRGICYIIVFYLLQKKGPLFTGMATYVIAPGALVWSWIDNEKVTFAQAGIVVFILLMVWLTQSKTAKPAPKSANGAEV